MDSKYQVAKKFNFEAGHRVWSQELNNNDLGLRFENKCRNIHGHSYKVIVYVSSDKLNEYGVVIDFTLIKAYMHELLEKLDHAMIIDVNDPLFSLFEQLERENNMKLFRVNFVPTAENLAKFIYDYLYYKLQKKVKIDKIEVYETATSVGTFIP